MSDRRFQCIICFDEFVEGIEGVEAACHNNHPWCRACITAAAEAAVRNLTDPSCMPPRCCGDPVLPTTDNDNDNGNLNSNLPNDDNHHAQQQQRHPALHLLGPAARAAWQQAVRQVRALSAARGVFVDRTVIRVARLARGEHMFQFCSRCQRLVIRAGGCNHIACLCGHDFCIICGGDWPVDNLEGLCHPYFGAHDEHVLQVPAEIQARLDEEERQLPAALANETAEGVLCRHPPDLLYTLRFRRELSVEERSEARCDECGMVARAFLLQCIGCRALLCLSCRDSVWDERPRDGDDLLGELQ